MADSVGYVDRALRSGFNGEAPDPLIVQAFLLGYMAERKVFSGSVSVATKAFEDMSPAIGLPVETTNKLLGLFVDSLLHTDGERQKFIDYAKAEVAAFQAAMGMVQLAPEPPPAPALVAPLVYPLHLVVDVSIEFARFVAEACKYPTPLPGFPLGLVNSFLVGDPSTEALSFELVNAEGGAALLIKASGKLLGKPLYPTFTAVPGLEVPLLKTTIEGRPVEISWLIGSEAPEDESVQQGQEIDFGAPG